MKFNKTFSKSIAPQRICQMIDRMRNPLKRIPQLQREI